MPKSSKGSLESRELLWYLRLNQACLDRRSRIAVYEEPQPPVRFVVCYHAQPCQTPGDDILNIRTMGHAVAMASRIASPRVVATIFRVTDGRRWYVCTWHWDQILAGIYAERIMEEAQVARVIEDLAGHN